MYCNWQRKQNAFIEIPAIPPFPLSLCPQYKNHIFNKYIFIMGEFKRTLITTALPYANGPIHIGHLAGVYVPADIYARYLRMKNEDVLLIGGSDEHGVPITLKAKNEGVTPQDVVDKFHKIIKKSFGDFGISFDVYSRTSSPIHHDTASEFFRKLYEEGKFIEKTTEQYYDEENNQFLADRYIIGKCPRCGFEKAYGDQCESCGTSLSPTELINPTSMISGNQPVLKETKHWYLPLDEYEPWLKEWILEGHKEWKPNVYGQCKSWIDSGLQPRAVTRDLDWGVPVPVEDTEGKVLYVWFDAPIGYISATKELTADWETYWKDPETRMLHFIGKDNIVFHCIIFPSMLKAEGTFNLPENVPANEFLNLENDKISTSRNWAVWLHEYLEEFPGKEDVLKYVLTANAPETKDNDFTWKDFQARNNNELVAVLGNFVNRALVLTQKYFNGQVPAKGELTTYDRNTLTAVSTIKAEVEKSLDSFRFREALKNGMDLARLGNKYLADEEPWKIFKTDPARVETILHVCLQITASLTIILEPFLPFSMEKLRGFLRMEKHDWAKLGETELLSAGHQVNQPELLFEKIEDDVIEKQLQKLLNTKKANEVASAKAKPSKANVTFDDFGTMDIRVGTIIEAEKVAKTKKLLKLMIDTGFDKRTVVSGIAEYYEPEGLIGKQVSVLVNLEPKNLKGIPSQGMILCAENADGTLSIVSPDKTVKNGSEVK
jgi:methionyl-tRNA synthetase